MYARCNYSGGLNDTETYSVGIYLRLSKEDEIAGQSESISNQRDYITSYVLEQGWDIYDFYIDDGYSGLNFDRPAFKRMISDIENKKINLVITKDLSRLGRDYIDTGNYIERYFPQRNVRYIALNDGIDTFASSANNDMSPFKSVINDMYAKDISKKVRAVLDTKRKKGQFIGAFAPYGYKKDPTNKNNIIIDEVAASVVRRIYSSYLSGQSMHAIVKMLNSEKVLSPAKYKMTNSNYKNARAKHYLWTQECISRILTNPSYMGNMTQGRQVKINYKLEKYRKIPRRNWIVAEGTHEPIISPEDFMTVQELIKRKMVHFDKGEKATHLLNGLLFCGECGSKMTYRRNYSKKMIVMCMNYSKYGPGLCTRHSMKEEVVESCVINQLKKISQHVLNDDFYKQFESFRPNKDKRIDNELQLVNKMLIEAESVIKALYIDKVKGIIDEDMFLKMSKEYKEQKEILVKRYSEILTKKKSLEKCCYTSDYMEKIKEFANFERPDKTLLSKLIDRIEITDEREINIYFSFPNPFHIL
ncbi:MAG TPA: recombinase family protein [Pseudobacteroides sp.]|nr:recombinase family protein [Pseudobacteroides sp.]